MRSTLYFRLAVGAMRRNGKLYTPYLLTCVGMTAVFYILSFLSISPLLKYVRGASVLPMILILGAVVIGVFSLIFLFYTNSFLIRRRNREFGLYNILGMGKRNIARLLAWETLSTAAVSLCGGLLVGIVLSKLSEWGLVRVLGGRATFSLSVSPKAILATVAVFAGIFLIIFLKSLLQLSRVSAVKLMSSEAAGEKPPRANWVLGVLGIALLAAAYWLAITIDDPIVAILTFFVAVIMVILATYLIFISGSVMICRAMQRNKRFYYKPNRFVSVSSMVYRMKRNGAGLASICILATMVLVMISSTSCLFFGADSSLRSRCPRDIMVEVAFEEPGSQADEVVTAARARLVDTFDAGGAQRENLADCLTVTASGYISGDELHLESDYEATTSDKPAEALFMELSDYNAVMGAQETLEPDEILLYTDGSTPNGDSLTVTGMGSCGIKKTLKDFSVWRSVDVGSETRLYIVVPELDAVLAALSGEEGSQFRLLWNYSFDCGLTEDEQLALMDGAAASLSDVCGEYSDAIRYYSYDSAAANRADFYATYSGLFFIGIMLSIVFILATVLIIYYKQLSEGYEDSRRFEIMQKLGMTRRDIRRSVNSQLLTVFGMPLAFAGLHLCFAFPFVRRMLSLFSLNDIGLLIATTVISFLVFAVVYALVYRATAGAYMSIVAGPAERDGGAASA